MDDARLKGADFSFRAGRALRIMGHRGSDALAVEINAAARAERRALPSKFL